jgi:hypothetical protein
MTRRTDNMAPGQYADLVRRVVAWVEDRQKQGETTKYWNIARKYNLRLDEIDDICGDSEVYGPQLMPLARPDWEAKGYTRVEVLS